MAVDAEATLLRYRSLRSSRAVNTGAQRYERPVYDYATKSSPCREGCPTGHDIPLALFLIGQGRPDLALRVFREESPFPAITGRVCYHPCEAACNRGEYDEPLAIAQLERFAGDSAAGGALERAETLHDMPVAVVGSGPSGLSCAYHLRRLGYPVDVYEAESAPGGALRHGIPAYRLPRAVLDAEVERLEALGVAFHCGVRVGEQLSFAQLREEHAAVFLGVGLARPRRLSIPGAAHSAVQPGLGFLRRIATGEPVRPGRRVLVVGGGDVAIDVARSALRLGAAEVTLCAVEEETALPCHPEELRAARAEGINLVAGWAPLEILAPDGTLSVGIGRVKGLTRDRYGAVTLDLDRAERRQLAADGLIYAIGQEVDADALPDGLAAGARVTVGQWGDTALPGVFAGGDVTGTYNVVRALASGKRAAVGIDIFLQRRHLPDLGPLIGVGGQGAFSVEAYRVLVAGRPAAAKERIVGYGELNLDYFAPRSRASRPEMAPAERVRGFGEVNASLAVPLAVDEARRCFNCGFCTMCGNCFTFCPDAAVVQQEAWGFQIDLDHCKGCGVCVHECPRSAMALVPEEEL